MGLPINKILCGDNRKILAELPEASIDLVVTSPPYWGLRDYGLGNDQIGLEENPDDYIEQLTYISHLIKRVLKPEGSFWLNIGDTYYGSGKGAGTRLEDAKEVYIMDKASVPKQTLRSAWLRPKQKMMIPARLAISFQRAGWLLRNDIIWRKPNAMPHPVKDRLNEVHEHVYFFVKNKKYYFDLDSIRVPHTSYLDESTRADWDKAPGYADKTFGQGAAQSLIKRARKERFHPNGKNPGSVWDINTVSFPGSHFAVFPPKLIEPIIKAACPEDGIVLDPFAGSGTALRVARKLGRKFIGIEMSPEWAEMCEARVRGDSYTPPPEGVKKLSTFSKTKRID